MLRYNGRKNQYSSTGFRWKVHLSPPVIPAGLFIRNSWFFVAVQRNWAAIVLQYFPAVWLSMSCRARSKAADPVTECLVGSCCRRSLETVKIRVFRNCPETFRAIPAGPAAEGWDFPAWQVCPSFLYITQSETTQDCQAPVRRIAVPCA